MIRKTTVPSVMVNISDLWDAVKELERRLNDFEEGGAPADTTDIEVRIGTLEKIIWGDDK